MKLGTKYVDLVPVDESNGTSVHEQVPNERYAQHTRKYRGSNKPTVVRRQAANACVADLNGEPLR